MSVDMNSQASDSNEEDFGVNSEEEDEEDGGEEEDQGDIEAYYDGVASDVEQQGADSFDPEEYQFTCLTYKESQRLLTEEVNTVATALKVSSSFIIATKNKQMFIYRTRTAKVRTVNVWSLIFYLHHFYFVLVF